MDLWPQFAFEGIVRLESLAVDYGGGETTAEDEPKVLFVVEAKAPFVYARKPN